ncbi:TrkH family potassium uptake protein [Neoehrlichia mikurensis]|uniref:TrkH family potassium uptake protein n=1 Tax=Neoehrlichia mikurensis TaxID=89586 RepID=A0A9Q9BTG2_9RICK|nr:TrkH family potassium uptake protein [Neoehrlichia mikurensis]QXK91615.1 TrkH family potassium uptake protein [Neoehrlichia mikurensis]QXK92826.1 TrkH family potassium uptake protein [Neoehrlichia mikurensis]QXK93306.1 TrkH family potassium uptake protein [Neoehrlichia mikurensis]UTO55752.1 TrkH family potassium uptake protein [Neoehrlichia mikurensis]UTO56669.1 TrkH family potassium uptake protein [Neoehrlichia mikurensis]
MISLRVTIFIVGLFSLFFANVMLIPSIVNLYANHDWQGFIISSLIVFFFGIGCILVGKLHTLKRGLVFSITSSLWIMLSILSSIPFILSDTKLSYIDAFFEATSGITTTGATVLSNLHEKSPGILLWRSILNSIGGLGIIVTGIFLFPCLKVISLYSLYHCESSDTSTRFKFGFLKTLVYILIIYSMLIILCTIFYKIAGMSIFDAICHALSTISTGGFSNYDNSLQYFNSIYIENIAIVFMLLSSCPFNMYLNAILEKRFFDVQVICLIFIIIGCSILSMIWIYNNNLCTGNDFIQCLRYVVFPFVSLSTSTGFTNYDYSHWGLVSMLGCLMMFIGGCSGSTNSGIKIYRILILLKGAHKYITSIVFGSHKEVSLRFYNKIINPSILSEVGMIFFLYISIFILSCMLVSLSGVDVTTSITAVIATLANTGPGIGEIVGPKGNYSTLLPLVKLLLSFLMLIGRLEIMPVFVFLYFIFYKCKNA